MNEFYNRERAAQRLPSNRVIERNSIKFWEEVWGNFAPVFESNTPIYGLRVNYRARFVRQTRIMIIQVGGLTRSLVADLEKLEIFEYWSLKSRCEYSLYLLFPSRWSNESKKEEILSTKRNSIDADSTIHINACFRLKLGISLRFDTKNFITRLDQEIRVLLSASTIEKTKETYPTVWCNGGTFVRFHGTYSKL